MSNYTITVEFEIENLMDDEEVAEHMSENLCKTFNDAEFEMAEMLIREEGLCSFVTNDYKIIGVDIND